MPMRMIQLPADLDTLPPLIDAAFQYPENPSWSLQTEDVESMADQLKMVKRLYPLLRLVGIVIPPLRDLLQGVIWEEEGKAIGLVNVMPRGFAKGAWIIGNVAVLPTYRRRGIARQLVENAVNYARKKQGSTIMLDVIKENVPAFALYQSLGFEPYGGSAELSRPASQEAANPSTVTLPTGYTLLESTFADWELHYRLALRITPPQVQVYEPVRPQDFRPAALLRALLPLIERLSGEKRKRFRLVYDGEVVAIGSYGYRTKAGGMNQLSMRVDPAHAQVAEPLIWTFLSAVNSLAPNRRTDMTIALWQPYVLEAAERAGFVKKFELHAMGLKIAQ